MRLGTPVTDAVTGAYSVDILSDQGDRIGAYDITVTPGIRMPDGTERPGRRIWTLQDAEGNNLESGEFASTTRAAGAGAAPGPDVDETLWNRWKETLKSRVRLESIHRDRAGGHTTFEFKGEDEAPWAVPVRHHPCVVVGLDIVGYSRRTAEGQLFLTSSLFIAMEAARDALRLASWLGRDEPRAVMPAGDGALVVFGTLQEAFAFTALPQNLWA